MDASLGSGSAVRRNGKKRGKVAKKKKKKNSASEATISLSQTTARLSFILCLFPPLRGRVPGYVDFRQCFFWSLSEKTPDGVTNRKGKAALSLSYTIVSRGDWLGKPANITVENNGAVVYVWSSLTVHNPWFFVHKLWLNKLMRCFHWSVSSKW